MESHIYIVEDAKDIVNPALNVLFYTSQFTRLHDTYDDNTYNEVQAFHFIFPQKKTGFLVIFSFRPFAASATTTEFFFK